MIISIEREERRTPVDARLEVDRSRPEAVQVTERVLGVVEPEVHAEILVMQVELAPVAVVGVLDPDDRLPEIRQVEQQPLLDLLELAALDFVHLGLVVVAIAEELVSTAEVHV